MPKNQTETLTRRRVQRLVRKFRHGDRVRLSNMGVREAKWRRGEYWDKWGTSGTVTGYSKGWLTGAINCVLVQCDPAYKAEPYQENLWELDIPNSMFGPKLPQEWAAHVHPMASWGRFCSSRRTLSIGQFQSEHPQHEAIRIG